MRTNRVRAGKKEIIMQGTGIWHGIYTVLAVVFVSGLIVFGGASSSAKGQEREVFAIFSLFSFLLIVANGFYWAIAAVNQTRTGEHFERLFNNQKETNQVERDHLAVFLYDLALQFLVKFADHYIEVASQHPEKPANRRDFWMMIGFVSSIINQLLQLGQAQRASTLTKQLGLRLDSKLVDIDSGAEWSSLKNLAEKLLGGMVEPKDLPGEYHDALRSTRIMEYVVKFD